MMTPNTAASFLALLNCLNTTNGSELRPEQVEFDVPYSLDGDEQNTGVTVRAINGEGYRGQVDVAYNRVDLTDLGESDGAVPVDVMPVSVGDALVYLNQHYGTSIEPIDIENIEEELYIEDPSYFQVQFTASAHSLAWTGMITMNLSLQDPELNTVVTQNVLEGLDVSDLVSE